MVGKKWDNVDRTVLRGSLTERNLARMCAQKRAFLLPARSQLQKDNSHCPGYRRLAGKMPIIQTVEFLAIKDAFTPVLAKCLKSFFHFPLVGYTLRNSCVHEGASPNFTIWGRTREKLQLLRRSDFRFFGPLRPNSLNRHAPEFHFSGTRTRLLLLS